MFNADGSEAEMCGNGVRCVAKYIHDHGIAPKGAGDRRDGPGGPDPRPSRPRGARVRRVRVDMGPPILHSADIPTTLPGDPPVNVPLTVRGPSPGRDGRLDGQPARGGPTSTTSPASPSRRWERCSSTIRASRSGSTRTSSRSSGRARSGCGRGSEGSGITLACGTGACAVCVAGVLTGKSGTRIVAHLPGGDLELEWKGQGQPVFMTGPAVEVFSGEWNG